MKPTPWAAVAWFALAVIALGMAINTFQSATEPGLGHAPTSALKASSATAVAPATVSLSAHATATPQTATTGKNPSPTAADRLLKCVVNGQVTYTNDPQECPSGASSSVTVYPTKGYLATRP